MSILDVVNLANQITCTLADSNKKKTSKVLKFQLQQWRPLNKTKVLLVTDSNHCREPRHWDRNCLRS